VDIYYRGEITIEQSADRVGFTIPVPGVYPADHQMQKNIKGDKRGPEDTK
jgi:hypothetical protein